MSPKPSSSPRNISNCAASRPRLRPSKAGRSDDEDGMRQRTLITGASSGLGAEMARQFAARGVDLGLCARRLDRLEQLRTEITAAYPERTVVIRPLDVDDHSA